MSQSPKKEPLYKLVFSTEPKKVTLCRGCNRELDKCCCGPNPDHLKCKPVVSFERKGRGGKSVTLVAKLPKDEKFLREMTTNLKRAVGAGGTYYLSEDGGVIEIQGDKRDSILKQVERYLKDLSTKVNGDKR